LPGPLRAQATMIDIKVAQVLRVYVQQHAAGVKIQAQ
jgi:hypothetical protein